MSTSLSQATPEPSWKQEVNRRLAAHKSRKPAPASEPEAVGERRPRTGSRATQAAARVAARYAKAPSYSEVLAAEAHVAVRSAAIATQVALEAQAAAHAAIAGLQAASGPRASQEAPQRLVSASQQYLAPVRTWWLLSSMPPCRKPHP